MTISGRILSRGARCLVHAFLSVVLLAAIGCKDDTGSNGGSANGGGTTSTNVTFLTMGTAPQGGIFNAVGTAVGDVLNQNKDAAGWRGVTASSTGGTLENLRLLDADEIQVGMANSTITYAAVQGTGGFEKPHEVKAIMTLFPLIAMFVTKDDTGIQSIEDLRGKRVVVGPEGAGFEYFIEPILEAHGISYADFEPAYAGMGTSVGYLQDGSVHATFIGGGIKAPAIATADTTIDIFLVPYGAEQRLKLAEELPSFSLATIPAGTYKNHPEAYDGLNVGSAHLIVRADADEEFVYQVTKIIYENRAVLAEKHAAARAINEKNVVRETGTEFHPGAIRFYREAGIWSEAAATGGESGTAETTDADAADAPEEDKDGSAAGDEPESATDAGGQDS